MDNAIIFTGGGGCWSYKVNCHANYDMFAVLIPLKIFILSAIQGFSKMSDVPPEKAKIVLFYNLLLFPCTQL